MIQSLDLGRIKDYANKGLYLRRSIPKIKVYAIKKQIAIVVKRASTGQQSVILSGGTSVSTSSQNTTTTTTSTEGTSITVTTEESSSNTGWSGCEESAGYVAPAPSGGCTLSKY